MSTKIYKDFHLHGSKDGKICLANITNPYGEGSGEVLSIAVALKSEGEPDWKIHIPYENLDELIKSLIDIKNQR